MTAVSDETGSGVVWRRVNGEPFEYAIQQGPNGDEFVKLLDGSCLRRALSAAPVGEPWKPGAILGIAPSIDRDLAERQLPQTFQDELTALRRAAPPAPAASVEDIIATFDKRMNEIGGCGDGYCSVTGKAKGMHTNGGCRCPSNKYTAQRVMSAGRSMRDAILSLLSRGE